MYRLSVSIDEVTIAETNDSDRADINEIVVDSSNSSQIGAELSSFALEVNTSKSAINAGDYVTYNHKLFKSWGLVTSRIVQVLGRCDIILENGDALASNDLVCVTHEKPAELKESNCIFKQLEDFSFIRGHIDSSEVVIFNMYFLHLCNAESDNLSCSKKSNN
jgi:hypothetical protein